MVRGLIGDPRHSLPSCESVLDPSLPFRNRVSAKEQQQNLNAAGVPMVETAPVSVHGAFKPQDVVDEVLKRLRRITTFEELHETLQFASDFLPACWQTATHERHKTGPAPASVPSVLALQKSYKRHHQKIAYLARVYEDDQDAQIVLDPSTIAVSTRARDVDPDKLREFLRAQLKARYTVPCAWCPAIMPREEGDEVHEDNQPLGPAGRDAVAAPAASSSSSGAGNAVAAAAADQDGETLLPARSIKTNKLLDYLPDLIDRSYLKNLKTAKEKKQYLTYVVSSTAGTTTQKVKTLQLSLGEDANEIVGHRSRFAFCTKATDEDDALELHGLLGEELANEADEDEDELGLGLGLGIQIQTHRVLFHAYAS